MWRPARGMRLMVISSFRLGSVGWVSAGRGGLASARSAASSARWQVASWLRRCVQVVTVAPLTVMAKISAPLGKPVPAPEVA
jgi:hypothetical protein